MAAKWSYDDQFAAQIVFELVSGCGPGVASGTDPPGHGGGASAGARPGRAGPLEYAAARRVSHPSRRRPEARSHGARATQAAWPSPLLAAARRRSAGGPVGAVDLTGRSVRSERCLTACCRGPDRPAAARRVPRPDRTCGEGVDGVRPEGGHWFRGGATRFRRGRGLAGTVDLTRQSPAPDQSVNPQRHASLRCILRTSATWSPAARPAPGRCSGPAGAAQSGARSPSRGRT